MQPHTIDHFIGQDHVTAQFRVALEASWSDGSRLPHMLLCGPPGCGKTSLAHIAAMETGSEVHEAIGQVLDSQGAMNGLLAQAGDKDVVFIDEIHETPVPSQTLLFRAIEDRSLFINGKNSQPIRIQLSDFCLVAATTDEFRLLAPLRDRFKLIFHFSHYQVNELTRIVLQHAHMRNLDLASEVAEQIALRSRQTPRLAIRLLEACHRVARSRGDAAITMDHFEQMILLEQIDAAGLDITQQRYLLALADRPGTAIRLHTLESLLSVHRRTIQSVVEPYLLRIGLVERNPQGRIITQKGLEHIGSTTHAG